MASSIAVAEAEKAVAGPARAAVSRDVVNQARSAFSTADIVQVYGLTAHWSVAFAFRPKGVHVEDTCVRLAESAHHGAQLREPAGREKRHWSITGG